GVVSLREALAYAELGSFADTPTITFDSRLAGGTIYLEHGALAINSSVAIVGNDITIDAQENSRVFYAKSYNYKMQTNSLQPSYNTIGECPDHDFSEEYMITVSLSGLTVTGGKTGTAYYYNGGGGIWADQNVNLVMNNCKVTGNTFVSWTGQCYEQGGGGLAITHYSTLQMDNCEVTDNQVYALEYDGATKLRGGGIFTASNSVAEITRTVITGNALTTPNAESNPTAYGSYSNYGGGVYSNGDLTIYRYCTVSNNILRGAVGENHGAGVYNCAKNNPRADETRLWAFRIDNSQIVGNIAGDSQVINNATSRGAGVYNTGYGIFIGDLIAENVIDGGSVTDVNVYGAGACGAGIFNTYLATVYYCTITNNVSQMVYYSDGADVLTPAVLKSYGAGFYNTGKEAAPNFIGCILVDNIGRCSTDTSITSKSDLYKQSDTETAFNVDRCLYDMGGVSGAGITYTNSMRRRVNSPLFEEGGYTLVSNSQAVDTFTTTDTETFYRWDLRNDPYVRVYGSAQDYGCYEYQPEPEPTPTFECTIDSYAGAYDAAAHTVTISGTQDGDVIYYSADGVNYSTSVISYTATGTRTVYVRVERAGYQDWLGSGIVSISQAQLVVSGTSVADKLCDGTTAADVTLGTVSGIIAGDDVTVATSAEFPSAEVGDYELTVSYILSGAQASNYVAPAAKSVTASIFAVPEEPVETLIVVTDAVPTVPEVDDPTVSVGGSANVITEAAPGDTVYVSVYVKSTDPNYGITVGYCSLYYDVDGFTPTGYYDSPNFPESTINSGYDFSASDYISAFGGVPSSATATYGKTQWALAGTEAFTVSATADGEYMFSNGMARNRKGNEKKSWNFLREDSPVTYNEEVAFTSTTFTVKGETPVDPVETLIVVTDAVPTVPEVDDPTISVGGSANVITEAAPGDTVYVSVYVKSTNPNYGITVGYCSLYYDVDGFTPAGYYDSPNFSESTINSGFNHSAGNYISAFGGVPSSMTATYGKTRWALAGTEAFTVSATADGEYMFSNGMARNSKGNEKKSWNFLREDTPITYNEEVTFTSTNLTVKSVDPVETCVVISTAVPTAAEVDSVSSVEEINLGDTFYVSVYVRSTNPLYGVTCGYCTINFDPDAFTVGSYIPSAIFSEDTFNDGYDYSSLVGETDKVYNIGGVPSSMTAAYGKSQWALAGTMSFTADAAGVYVFSNSMARNRKGEEKESFGFVRQDSDITYAYNNSYDSATVVVVPAAITDVT
ncbi:MAG: hypothetical protein IKE69_11930, partial [Thermoguttaceae bacterium]|nr:hypothetical protein [Thermoguttaceae bacterium]